MELTRDRTPSPTTHTQQMQADTTLSRLDAQFPEPPTHIISHVQPRNNSLDNPTTDEAIAIASQVNTNEGILSTSVQANLLGDQVNSPGIQSILSQDSSSLEVAPPMVDIQILQSDLSNLTQSGSQPPLEMTTPQLSIYQPIARTWTQAGAPIQAEARTQARSGNCGFFSSFFCSSNHPNDMVRQHPSDDRAADSERNPEGSLSIAQPVPHSAEFNAQHNGAAAEDIGDAPTRTFNRSEIMSVFRERFEDTYKRPFNQKNPHGKQLVQDTIFRILDQVLQKNELSLDNVTAIRTMVINCLNEELTVPKLKKALQRMAPSENHDECFKSNKGNENERLNSDIEQAIAAFDATQRYVTNLSIANTIETEWRTQIGDFQSIARRNGGLPEDRCAEIELKIKGMLQQAVTNCVDKGISIPENIIGEFIEVSNHQLDTNTIRVSNYDVEDAVNFIIRLNQ